MGLLLPPCFSGFLARCLSGRRPGLALLALVLTAPLAQASTLRTNCAGYIPASLSQTGTAPGCGVHDLQLHAIAWPDDGLLSGIGRDHAGLFSDKSLHGAKFAPGEIAVLKSNSKVEFFEPLPQTPPRQPIEVPLPGSISFLLLAMMAIGLATRLPRRDLIRSENRYARGGNASPAT